MNSSGNLDRVRRTLENPTYRDASFFLLVFPVYVLVCLGLYWSVIDAFFLADDFYLVRGARDSDTGRLWVTVGYFRPIVSLSFLGDYRIWGLNPLGYHLLSVLVHSLNSLLAAFVFFLLCHYVPRIETKRLLALLVGLLFLVMPCHVEAVSWISARTDLLATLFCMTSLAIFLLFMRGTRGALLVSLFFYLCALLSKESVVAFPAIILALLLFICVNTETDFGKFARLLYIPLFYGLTLGLYFFLRHIAMGGIFREHTDRILADFLRLTVFQALDRTCLLWVKSLVPIHEWPSVVQAWTSMGGLAYALKVVAGAAVVIVAVLTVVFSCASIVKRGSLIRVHERIPHVLLASIFTCCFLAAALPVIPSPWPIAINPEGDRYMYFPSIFTVITIVILLQGLLRRSRTVALAVILIGLGYTSCSYTATDNWRAASILSRSVVSATCEAAKHGRAIIVNLPETFSGAYVLRYGFFEALELFANSRWQNRVAVVTWQTLNGHGRAVEFKCLTDAVWVRFSNPLFLLNGDADRDNPLIVAPVKPGGTFETPLYHIVDFKPQEGFGIRFKDLGEQDTVLYQSNGRIMKLSCHETLMRRSASTSH